MSLKERYGPWALIVGGPEGIGDHLARKHPQCRRGRGGILMIGSMAGNAGSYFLATYSAAKAYNRAPTGP
jgi:hypothetical protein